MKDFKDFIAAVDEDNVRRTIESSFVADHFSNVHTQADMILAIMSACDQRTINILQKYHEWVNGTVGS